MLHQMNYETHRKVTTKTKEITVAKQYVIFTQFLLFNINKAEIKQLDRDQLDHNLIKRFRLFLILIAYMLNNN